MIPTTLAERINDPVTLEPYQKAQQTNCKHHFSLSVAMDIFGEMHSGALTKLASCPVCRQNVTRYEPDCEFQDMVDEILKLSKPQTPTSSSLPAESTPSSSQPQEKRANSEIEEAPRYAKKQNPEKESDSICSGKAESSLLGKRAYPETEEAPRDAKKQKTEEEPHSTITRETEYPSSLKEDDRKDSRKLGENPPNRSLQMGKFNIVGITAKTIIIGDNIQTYSDSTKTSFKQNNWNTYPFFQGDSDTDD